MTRTISKSKSKAKAKSSSSSIFSQSPICMLGGFCDYYDINGKPIKSGKCPLCNKPYDEKTARKRMARMFSSAVKGASVR